MFRKIPTRNRKGTFESLYIESNQEKKQEQEQKTHRQQGKEDRQGNWDHGPQQRDLFRLGRR